MPLVLDLTDRMAPAGALPAGTHPAAGMPQSEIRFDNVRFAYPSTDRLVLDGLDLTIPAGHSLAIVGQNGAGKTTLAKLLCRMYDPTEGAIRVDGVDLRDIDIDAWRARIAAVFQDYVRYELTLRDNVAPAGAPSDDDVLAALEQRTRRRPHRASTPCCRARTTAAAISRAGSGSASRWRAPCARCGSAPGS